MASAAFRSSATAGAASGTSIAAPSPAGWAAGDYIIIHAQNHSQAALATTPAGWTELGDTGTHNVTDFASYSFGRPMQAGDSLPTISWDTAGELGCESFAYQPGGGDTQVTLDTSNDTLPAQSFSQPTKSLTTANANETLVQIESVDIGNTSAYSFAPDASTTERVDVDVDSTTRRWRVFVADEIQAAAGASTVRTHTLTGGSTQTSRNFTVALISGAGTPVATGTLPQPLLMRLRQFMPGRGIPLFPTFQPGQAATTGVVHRTATRNIVWNVLRDQQADRRVVWNVRRHQQADRRIVWTDRAHPVAQRRVVWNVRGHSTATRRVVWNVRGHPTATRRVVWNVRARETATRRVVWNIRVRPVAMRRIVWTDRGHPVAQRRIVWNVESTLNHRTTTRGIVWDVRRHVTASSRLVWNVEAPLVETPEFFPGGGKLEPFTKHIDVRLRVVWNVTAPTETDLYPPEPEPEPEPEQPRRLTRLRQRAHRTATLAVSWQTLARRTATRDIGWDIHAHTIGALGVGWAVRSLDSAATLGIGWDIHARSTGKLWLRWDIEEPEREGPDPEADDAEALMAILMA